MIETITKLTQDDKVSILYGFLTLLCVSGSIQKSQFLVDISQRYAWVSHLFVFAMVLQTRKSVFVSFLASVLFILTLYFTDEAWSRYNKRQNENKLF